MKKVLTIGGATYDIYIEYACPDVREFQTSTGKRSFLVLEEGLKIDVDAVSYHSGGGATNSAVSFSQLGISAVSAFKLGRDLQAQFILDELRRYGVSDVYPRYSDTAHTSTAVIIPCPSGNRSVLVYRGATEQLSADDVPASLYADVDQIYITSLSKDAAHLLPELVAQATVPVAVNPGTSQLSEGVEFLIKALADIDILILNALEASVLMHALVGKGIACDDGQGVDDKHDGGPELLVHALVYEDVCFSLKNFFDTLLAGGPRIVVVTNGEDGVYVATKQKRFYCPSLSVDVVNTVGAGDAFGSCFVAQLLYGQSLEDAARAGVINSASVIQHTGAKNGLLTREELMQRLKTDLKIQPF